MKHYGNRYQCIVSVDFVLTDKMHDFLATLGEVRDFFRFFVHGYSLTLSLIRGSIYITYFQNSITMQSLVVRILQLQSLRKCKIKDPSLEISFNPRWL